MTRGSAFIAANGSRSASRHSRRISRSVSHRGDDELGHSPPSRTGSGSSTAAQRRTTSRLTLSVWVRGRSSSGQIRNPATRWCWASVALAALIAGLDRRADRLGRRPVRRAGRRQHDRLDAPGLRLDDDGVAQPRGPERVLDVLGVHVQAVRQHDDVLRPAHQHEPPGVVEPADVAGPVPAVLGERRRGRLGVVPVALEDRRAAELDLAVVGEAHLDRRHRPADGPEPVVLAGRARPEAGLGRAVALDDDDAEVLPGLLERRRQERAGADEDPEATAELRDGRVGTGSAAARTAGAGRSAAADRTWPRARTSRPRVRPPTRTGRGSGARRPSTSSGGRGSPRRSPAGSGSGRRARRPRRRARSTARPPARTGARAAAATRRGAPSAG